MFIGLGIGIPLTPTQGGGVSQLFRENDGTVTAKTLARVWRAVLIRQPDGTVTVSQG